MNGSNVLATQCEALKCSDYDAKFQSTDTYHDVFLTFSKY